MEVPGVKVEAIDSFLVEAVGCRTRTGLLVCSFPFGSLPFGRLRPAGLTGVVVSSARFVLLSNGSVDASLNSSLRWAVADELPAL